MLLWHLKTKGFAWPSGKSLTNRRISANPWLALLSCHSFPLWLLFTSSEPNNRKYWILKEDLSNCWGFLYKFCASKNKYGQQNWFLCINKFLIRKMLQRWSSKLIPNKWALRIWFCCFCHGWIELWCWLHCMVSTVSFG